tara:strand:- start:74 stop:766 length:693 start_codon:yes stop_codon:yes gene_type:complete
VENIYKKKSFISRFVDKFQRRNRGNLFLLIRNFIFYLQSKIDNFTLDKRAYIIKQFKKKSIIAEIGVWRGDFSQEIVVNANPKELVLVDPWIYDEEIRGCAPQFKGSEPINQKFFDDAKNFTYKKFESLDFVKILHMNSENASSKFDNNYFDYIYIDGEHSYKAVIKDLKSWYPKLKINGKIFGDDFYWREEDNSFSVKKAYEDFIKENKIKKWCVFKSQICIIKENVYR